MRAASTPASLNLFAIESSTTPVCTTMVSPVSRFTSAMASTNLSRGTEPSGKHPPLIRQPTAPFLLSLAQRQIRSSGVVAGIIVFSTFPPQCLHLKAQEEPVTEIDGKAAGDEQK